MNRVYINTSCIFVFLNRCEEALYEFIILFRMERRFFFNQVSIKNDYDYGFSMVFNDKQAYDTCNNHPDHVAFVEHRWKKEVARFLEIDFISH